MEIGDKVQLVAILKDIVQESSLIEMEEDSRQYWILSKHLQEMPPPGAVTTAKTSGAKPVETPPEKTPAEPNVEPEELPDLESRTKDELVKFAHKQGLELDARQPKDHLIAQIEEHHASAHK